MSFSELSKKLTSEISTTDKKKGGIFFTPFQTVDKIIDYTKNILDSNKKLDILEPSCGSGQFLEKISSAYPNSNITGVELQDHIFQTLKDRQNSNHFKDIQLIHHDFLTWNSSKKYNLIIGNPPFGVVKKNSIPSSITTHSLGSLLEGRPNLFILFIIKSLYLLSDGGLLAFVLPKNFLNCLYYQKVRKYIDRYFKIHTIQYGSGDYLDTNQDTIYIIIEKIPIGVIDKIDNRQWCWNPSGYSGSIFFCSGEMDIIKKLSEGSTSLKKLNFRVGVGNTVWNQCKDKLTTDNRYTRLIYSSDIKDGKLLESPVISKNPERKNYIKAEGWKLRTIVINRGYGMGRYHFNYSLIDVNYPYLIENHLIYIVDDNTDSSDNSDILQKILKSFNDSRTTQFINLYFGNNAINVTELQHILPIYID